MAAAARPAPQAAVVQKNVVRTGTEAGAELEFTDLTLARLGANSIFSFDAQALLISHKAPFFFRNRRDQANWRHGDPSAFDRITGYLNAAVLYIPIEHFQVTGFIRPEGKFYTNDPVKASRKDFNLSVGSAASWTPIENVIFGVTASYVGNFSSVGARRYDVFVPSIVAASRIAF